MGKTHPDSPMARNIKLGLMRVLIASYLMATSVGIAPGPDLVPTLSRFLPDTQAKVIGAALLFLPAYTMMAGIWLRASIHILAMMVVLSTLLELFVFQSVPSLATVWQEVITLIAMLQCLMLLKGRHFRHSSLVKRKIFVRQLNPMASNARPRDDLPGFVHDVSGVSQKPNMVSLREPLDDDDVENIFAT